MNRRRTRRRGPEAAAPAPATRLDRQSECLRGGVGLLIRVSSHFKNRASEGSVAYQRSQANQVKKWGGDPEDVLVFEFLGHSAGRDAPKTHLERVLAEVKKGRIQTIILGWASRLSRGWEDTLAQLFEALKKARGAIIVQGRFYDLLDYEDSHRLRQQILEAERENEERALQAAVGKYELAQELKLLVPLPTGLVCADPVDPPFVAAMRSSGLEYLLSPEELSKHRTQLRKEDRPRFIFPDPREDCWKAVTFILKTLLDRGSIASVVEAIMSANLEDYPRPGFYPAVAGSTFGVDRLDAGNQQRKRPPILWHRVRNRADGRDEAVFGRIRDLVYSPALYGIYAYEPASLRDRATMFPEGVAAVWEPGAFPGLLAPADYDAVLDVVGDPARRNLRKGPEPEVRTNIVTHLTCAHPLPNGNPCGLSYLAAFPTDAARHRYVSASCGKRGHASTLPPSIDDSIQAILIEAVTEEQVREEFTIAMQGEHEIDEQVRQARCDIEELEHATTYSQDQAAAANRAKDHVSEESWKERHRKEAGRLQQKRLDLRHLQYRHEEVERIAATERADILALANDFPVLLSAARQHDELAPMLVKPLIQDVHVRRLGEGTYWVEIAFPSGERWGRIHLGGDTPSTEVMRALAWEQLGPLLEPLARTDPRIERKIMGRANAVARRWNHVLQEEIKRGRWKQWTGERVLAIAYRFDQRSDVIRVDDSRLATLAALADRCGRPQTEVLVAALDGRLGRPALDSHGAVRLAPDPSDFRLAFPDAEIRTRMPEAATSVRWVRLWDIACRNNLDPRLLAENADVQALAEHDSAGEVWVNAESQGRILQLGRMHREAKGAWMSFSDAARHLPGLTRKPLERVAPSGWPEAGPEQRARRLFWIDDDTKAALRTQTVQECLKGSSWEDHRSEVHLQTDVKKRLKKLAAMGVSDIVFDYAVSQGRVSGFTAAEAPYGRPRRWLLVPASVWDECRPAAVEAWLRGDCCTQPRGPSDLQ